MPRITLTLQETRDLFNINLDILNYIDNIRQKITKTIYKDALKNIQVPVQLSESIALNLLRNGIIHIPDFEAENFSFGEARNDYDIKHINNLNIEVKATGTKDFQRFRSHALKSNYTIWIDFYGLREKQKTNRIRYLLFRTNEVFPNVTGNERTMTVKKLTLAHNKTFTEYNLSI